MDISVRQWTYTGRRLPDGRWEARAVASDGSPLSERHPDRHTAEAMLRRTVAAFDAMGAET